MGCCHSFVRKRKATFGATGLHVGRDGDVDLTSRSMDVFGVKFVHLIKYDEFHSARSLHLSDNKLYTLGKEMQLLTGIEEMYIDNNRFERLPRVFASMSNLRLIDASKNPLGNQSRALEVLPRVANLTHVALRSCLLGLIPQCLLECAMLTDLDLSDNLLQFEGVSFAALRALRTLRVANCGITGEIPLGIKEIRTLEALDISSNLFNFDSEDFFGKYLVGSLTALHLRSMKLVAVPQVVIFLCKLSYIDLAENPLETLAVLAGRLVRKLAVRSLAPDQRTALTTESNNDAMSVISYSSAHLSINQLSRAGCISHAEQPLPLQKISLRACGFQRLPKYFHKLNNLVDIDLSENHFLNDPNMTLFSFSNLQVLNIVGCPFVENRHATRNEWFDIASLSKLHTISWGSWKNKHNTNPYNTKVPLELCGLRLKEINGVEVRPGLFIGDTVDTIINLMRDAYYNVDLALSDELIKGYAEALRALVRLESFFFNGGINDDKHVTNSWKHTNNDGETSGSKTSLSGNNACLDVLKIVVDRYIFFLTMQAANYNTVIIPPADVMAIHYAQLTHDPVFYRADCDAICGQVLGCNYSFFFLEQKLQLPNVNDMLENSKFLWNMMVKTAQKNFEWLNYEFWESCVKQSSTSVDMDAEKSGTEVAELPAFPLHKNLIFSDFEGVHHGKDLSELLDISITKHFMEQCIERYSRSLKHFFTSGKCFLNYEEELQTDHLLWKPYVKYLALYAHVCRLKKPVQDKEGVGWQNGPLLLQNASFVSQSCYLPLPVEKKTFVAPAPQRKIRRRSGFVEAMNAFGASIDNAISGSTNISPADLGCKAIVRNKGTGNVSRSQDFQPIKPVPTKSILFLLHAHRILHTRYHQTLALLGIDDIDVEWDETRASLEATMESWAVLYNERYVKDPKQAFPQHDWPEILVSFTEGNLYKGLFAGALKRIWGTQKRVKFCCINT